MKTEKLEITIVADEVTTSKIMAMVYKEVKTSHKDNPFNTASWKFSKVKDTSLIGVMKEVSQ